MTVVSVGTIMGPSPGPARTAIVLSDWNGSWRRKVSRFWRRFGALHPIGKAPNGLTPALISSSAPGTLCRAAPFKLSPLPQVLRVHPPALPIPEDLDEPVANHDATVDFDNRSLGDGISSWTTLR
jgi:hypothetical protein